VEHIEARASILGRLVACCEWDSTGGIFRNLITPFLVFSLQLFLSFARSPRREAYSFSKVRNGCARIHRLKRGGVAWFRSV
jgi:hypothetical protein